MNDFTKAELELLGGCVFTKWLNSITDPSISHLNADCKKLGDKIQGMIDNYKDDPWDRNKIAKSHLNDASSLISHAICLLGLDDE